MTSFEKQWEVAAKIDRLQTEFRAEFMIRHPEIGIVAVHDSLLFESEAHYRLYRSELEEFLRREEADATILG